MAVYSPASNLKKTNFNIGLHPNFWNLLNLIKWQVRATNFEKIHLVFSCNSRKSGNFKHIWVYQVGTDLFQKPTSTGAKHHLHEKLSTIRSDNNPVKYHVPQCRFAQNIRSSFESFRLLSLVISGLPLWSRTKASFSRNASSSSWLISKGFMAALRGNKWMCRCASKQAKKNKSGFV